MNLEEHIHWTDDAKVQLRAEMPERPPLDGSFATLGPQWKEMFTTPSGSKDQTPIDALRSGATRMTPDALQIAERMIQFYGAGKEPPSLDPVADAATFGILSVEGIAPYLLARGGPTFIAEALIASYNVSNMGFTDSNGHGRAIVIEPGKGSHLVFVVAKWMRSVLTDAQQVEARPIVEAARLGADFALRVAISFAARDRAWAIDDANDLLVPANAETVRHDAARFVFATLRDLPALEKLVKKFPKDAPLFRLIDDLGLKAAPVIARVVESSPENEYNCQAAAVLQTVVTAKALALSLASKRGGTSARAFYKRRPDLGFVALAPIVAAEGKTAPFVKPELDAILRAHPDYATTLAEHLDAKTRNVFGKISQANAKPKKTASMGDIPRALQTWPDPRKGKKIRELPDFADASKLPAVLLADGETALPETAADNLLATLMQSTLEEPDSNIPVIKKACEPKSLNAFVWTLFEAWLTAGANSKEGWAFTALGHFGNDDTARRLTPLIRAWPGESQHARAVNGCGILAAIGTDVALMHLHGIAQKVKFKGLQQRAQIKIGEIARARSLTAEQLGDRLVPDLGLDEAGSMSLDLGERQFTVGFDHTLKPFVLDATGKRVRELPKAGKSDDAEKAADAHTKWKALKKDAKAIAAAQIARFEMAMCAQRRWSTEDFKTFIVDHPLVVHVARRVVFGVFDPSSKKLTATFRVSEDRTYANEQDERLTLNANDSIGVVHRLELENDATLARWGEILGEYEIIQPFDQLGRAIYTPTDAEKGSPKLARLSGVTVKTGKIMGLESRGWRKGPPQDAGWIWNMLKPLGGAFHADMGIKGGICIGYMEGTPSEQQLDELTLRPGNLGDLSATAFSELVRDLEMLRDP